MLLIVFLLVGAVAGLLLAQILRNDGFGLVPDIAIGVIGGLIGGWLFGELGIISGGPLGSIVAGTIGAIYLTSILRALKPVLPQTAAQRRLSEDGRRGIQSSSGASVP